MDNINFTSSAYAGADLEETINKINYAIGHAKLRPGYQFKTDLLKPGIIIHCGQEDEAYYTVHALEERGYRINGNTRLAWLAFRAQTCYRITNHGIITGPLATYQRLLAVCHPSVRDAHIVEFKDLIEYVQENKTMEPSKNTTSSPRSEATEYAGSRMTDYDKAILKQYTCNGKDLVLDKSLLKENVVINCKSEECASALLAALAQEGYAISDLARSAWAWLKEDTCFKIKGDTVISGNRKVYQRIDNACVIDCSNILKPRQKDAAKQETDTPSPIEPITEAEPAEPLESENNSSDKPLLASELIDLLQRCGRTDFRKIFDLETIQQVFTRLTKDEILERIAAHQEKQAGTQNPTDTAKPENTDTEPQLLNLCCVYKIHPDGSQTFVHAVPAEDSGIKPALKAYAASYPGDYIARNEQILCSSESAKRWLLK